MRKSPALSKAPADGASCTRSVAGRAPAAGGRAPGRRCPERPDGREDDGEDENAGESVDDGGGDEAGMGFLGSVAWRGGTTRPECMDRNKRPTTTADQI
jgi:hypothetical protein